MTVFVNEIWMHQPVVEVTRFNDFDLNHQAIREQLVALIMGWA